MNKRVSELEGAELDYWVAKAEGAVDNGCGDWIFYEGSWCGHEQIDQDLFRPSASWNCGGPIIERHGCSIQAIPEGGWSVYDDNTEQWYWDDSLLVAAMRAFVASKLGDTVEEIDK